MQCKGQSHKSCSNIKVINELNLPILTVGLKDSVVALNDGILISDKDKSSGIKLIVERIKTSLCYGEKSWGTYTIKNQGYNFKCH